MWRFLVPLTLIVSEAASQYHNIYQPISAASEAQIKFATENKYDDTGPGAKGREYAYNTYKTLDEALIGYLNDPDTKLPEQEKARALNIISSYGQQKSFNTQHYPSQYQNKPFNSFAFPENRIYRPENRKPSVIFNYDAIPVSTPPAENHLDSFKHQRVQNVKGSPITVGHYTKARLPLNDYHKFDSVPQLSNHHGYSTQSSRAPDSHPIASQHAGVAENVGYYTFVDGNGKAQTVHFIDDGRRSRQIQS